VRRIREETGDGEELVDYMLRVFRDEGESTKTGVEAASRLADRGLRAPAVALALSCIRRRCLTGYVTRP
jgi:hypothetical protein